MVAPDDIESCLFEFEKLCCPFLGRRAFKAKANAGFTVKVRPDSSKAIPLPPISPVALFICAPCGRLGEGKKTKRETEKRNPSLCFTSVVREKEKPKMESN